MSKIDFSKSANIVVISQKNLGDALSHWLYSSLSGKRLRRVRRKFDGIAFLTAGSVLRLCRRNHVIMGSGFISKDDDLGKTDWDGPFNSETFQRPIHILSVRGPKTARKLERMGIPAPNHFGDPLLVAPLVYNPKVKKKYQVGFVPHVVDQKNEEFLALKNRISENRRTRFIDIFSGRTPRRFIRQLKSCETIVSSSLHGVIFGLAYGCKTIYRPFSDDVIGDGFKFADFFESAGIEYEIPDLDQPDFIEQSIQYDPANLIQLGNDIVNVCPFIADDRKLELNEHWRNLINSYKTAALPSNSDPS